MVDWRDSPAVPDDDTRKFVETTKQLSEQCYGPRRFEIENAPHSI